MSLIILMGKTASGKDTVQRELADTYGYEQLMSSTDRPMRPGEKYGVQYNFRTKGELNEMVVNGKMLECRAYEVVNDSGNTDIWRYGLEKPQNMDIENKKYVTILPPSAIKSVMENVPAGSNVQLYYLNTPDDIRKDRRSKRGDLNELEWNRRLITDTKDFSPEIIKSLGAKEIPGALPALVVAGLVMEADKKADREHEKQQIKEQQMNNSTMAVKRPSRGIEMVFDRNLGIPVEINNIPEKHPQRRAQEVNGFFFSTEHGTTYTITQTDNPAVNILNGGAFNDVKIYAPNPLSIMDQRPAKLQIVNDPAAYGNAAGRIIQTSSVCGGIHQIRNVEKTQETPVQNKEYKKVVYFEDLEKMPKDSPERKAVENVRMPNNLAFIPKEYFKGCENLKRIDIPERTVSIGDNAFEGCKSLTDVSIPNSIFAIGDNAFKDCSNLSNLDMPMKFLDDADRIFSGENNLNWDSVRASIENNGLSDAVEDEDIGNDR